MKLHAACPKGHRNIDYNKTGKREYIFCYTCLKRYYEKDYKEVDEDG